LAYQHLKCEEEMTIIRGASHLFEEKGTLEEAAKAAKSWFLQHMVSY
jgi:putative phosphoribosyl transferase